LYKLPSNNWNQRYFIYWAKTYR